MLLIVRITTLESNVHAEPQRPRLLTVASVALLPASGVRTSVQPECNTFAREREEEMRLTSTAPPPISPGRTVHTLIPACAAHNLDRNGRLFTHPYAPTGRDKICPGEKAGADASSPIPAGLWS